MGITTTKDLSAAGGGDFGRFTTNQAEKLDENAVHGLDAIDRPASDTEPAEGFGIPGGLPKDHEEREAERVEAVEAVVPGEYVDGLGPNYFEARDPNEDAPDDMDSYGPMNPPRHDKYADENSPYPTPDRVVPSTPTNANPTFADYEVPTTDQPGSAREAAEDGELVFTKPTIPLAGEGSFEVRDPTEDATGATSPIGDEHNDPTGDRGADTYEEAKDIAAEHGGTIKDFGQGPIPKAGEGSEPPGMPEVAEQQVEALAAGEDPSAVPGVDADGRPIITEGYSHEEKNTVPEPTGDDPSPEEIAADEDEEDEPAGPPPKSALKADWIEYVLATYETDLETVSAMTKDEIIATYGE